MNYGLSKHYAGSQVSDRCSLGCLFYLGVGVANRSLLCVKFFFFFFFFFFGGGGGGDIPLCGVESDCCHSFASLGKLLMVGK